jgi:hypothetical protein
MGESRARWLAFYAEKVGPAFKEIVSHIEKIVIGTLIVSAGAHVSSNEPAIQLFGYLRHGLVGRGVMLVGIIILFLNFIDGLYRLTIASTCLAVLFVPTFFVVVQRFENWLAERKASKAGLERA